MGSCGKTQSRKARQNEMKKPIAAILCIALLLVFGFKIFDKPNSAEIEYYTSINRMIKDQDFYTARVSEGEISLYDKNNIIVETMGFDFYDRSIPLVTIRKEFGNLYFVTAGSVDDEYGVYRKNPNWKPAEIVPDPDKESGFMVVIERIAK